MTEIVSIRFKPAGRLYNFNPAGFELNPGDWVVVDTGRGPEIGRVITSPKQVPDSDTTEALKSVLRKPTDDDFKKKVEYSEKAAGALDKCESISHRLNLPMKFISAEYNLDGSRLTIFFSAEGRVDFRDLLKELSSSLKTRIELRQVGPRDEAKLLGGCGRCGRELCCTTYLSEFSPVSIRMAKEQDLPLNPMKISGLCGRLLCCLSHESVTYRQMKDKLPPVGQKVNTPAGTAIVVGGNALKETVLVQLESEAVTELPLSDISQEGQKPPKKKGG